jgi:hypothetical protein
MRTFPLVVALLLIHLPVVAQSVPAPPRRAAPTYVPRPRPVPAPPLIPGPGLFCLVNQFYC